MTRPMQSSHDSPPSHCERGLLGSSPGTGNLHGYQNSIVSAINNQGQVVGCAWAPSTRAQIYDDLSKLIADFNDPIPPDSGWQLVYANDINDAGQIVGQG